MLEGGHTASCAEPGDVETGNVAPLLHQIRHALRQLLETGNETIVDLRSLPMGPGEEDRLVAALGQGEVQVLLTALGPSEIIETQYPGVWLVTHQNSDGEIIGKFIEVCEFPRLCKAQAEDIRAGLQRLEEQLS
ncbi:MAG: hydrogenase expression/formation C-terminal domain-containing protein [Gammaproteobacteria bacterium]